MEKINDCHTKITYLELEVEQLKLNEEEREKQINAIDRRVKQMEPVAVFASHKNVWIFISIVLGVASILMQLLTHK